MNLAIKLLDVIIKSEDSFATSCALSVVRDHLVASHGIKEDDVKHDASAFLHLAEEARPAAPVALPVVEAAIAPVVAQTASQEVVESHEDSRPVADRDQRSIDYDALYEEGKGQYLLLEGEDEIEAGDEWIIKPECDTNRARRWRSASDFGKEVGEFTRSHYRRRI